MNANQRKDLGLISDSIQTLIDGEAVSTLTVQPQANEDANRAYLKVCRELTGVIDDYRSQVEDHRDTEQEKYDNMPESLQGGERGEAMQEGIDALEDAVASLEEAQCLLTDAEFNPRMVDDLVEFLEGAVEAIGNV